MSDDTKTAQVSKLYSVGQNNKAISRFSYNDSNSFWWTDLAEILTVPMELRGF